MMSGAWVSSSVADCLVPVSVTGKSKIQSRDYKPNGRFPVIDQGQEQIAGWTNDESAVIDTPLPLVIFGDHTRAFKYVDVPFARGADGTQLLYPKPDIAPLFFFYACRAIDLPARGYNRHFTVLKEKELSYPTDSDEQKAIADVLHQTEMALKKQADILQTLQELKQSAMRELFTKGLRGEAQKDTDLGSVPESWKLKELGSVSDTQLGKMLSEKARGGKSPKPYLRNKNVQWGRLDLSDLLQMDFDERETKKFELLPGDLLICEGGVIGRSAIWRGEVKECYFQKALHRVRPRTNEASNDFLLYWMSFSFEHQSLYNIGGASSTIAHLPQQLLEGLIIPLPGKVEQQEIVTILSAVDRKIDLHRQKRAVLEELFQSLLHKLMTGEIRVSELDLSALAKGETA